MTGRDRQGPGAEARQKAVSRRARLEQELRANLLKRKAKNRAPKAPMREDSAEPKG
jgi:hypothetical protein